MTKSVFLYLLAGIGAMTLALGIGRFAYTPMIPIMQEQASLSVFNAGLIASVNYLGYFIGAIIPLFIGDKLSQKWLFNSGIIATIACLFLMGFTKDSIYLWSIWRFIAGVASAFALIATSKIILAYLKEHQATQYSGLIYGAIGLGICISALIVEYCSLQWQHYWIAFGLISIVFAIPCLWIKDAKSTPSKPIEFSDFPWWVILITFGYGCSGYGYITSATFLPILLNTAESSESANLMAWFIVGLTAIPSSLIWSFLSKRFGEPLCLLALMVILAISIIMPVLIANETSLIFSAILFGISFLPIVGLTLQFFSHFTENATRYIALATIGFSAGQFIGPIVTSYLTQHLNFNMGLFDTGLIAAFAITLLGIVSFAAGFKKLNHH